MKVEQSMPALPGVATLMKQQLVLLFRSARGWVVVSACIALTLLFESSRIHGARGTGLLLAPWEQPVPVRLLPLLMLIGVGWALLVWWDEPWGKRDYHRSLPVQHARHDLLRVAAGAVTLVIAVLCSLAASALVWIVQPQPTVDPAMSATVARALEHPMPIAAADFLFYLNVVTTPLLSYVAASVFPVFCRRPLEWIVSVVLCVGLLSGLSQLFPEALGALREGLGIISAPPYGIFGALSGGVIETAVTARHLRNGELHVDLFTRDTWLAALALWTAIFVGLLALALRRRA